MTKAPSSVYLRGVGHFLSPEVKKNLYQKKKATVRYNINNKNKQEEDPLEF